MLKPFTFVIRLLTVVAPAFSAEVFITNFADQRFALINGTDIRDFYQGSFANTINGTTTKEVFRIDNVQTQNLVTMKITPPSLARSCSSE